VAIVWPARLRVDARAAADRDLGFSRPHCPACAGPLVALGSNPPSGRWLPWTADHHCGGQP